jgi:hypothetical protein
LDPFQADGNFTKASIKVILQQEPPALHAFFPQTLPLERLDITIPFLHLTVNSTVHKCQEPVKLFLIHTTVQHLNKEFQNLYLSNQNIVTDESLTLWKG